MHKLKNIATNSIDNKYNISNIKKQFSTNQNTHNSTKYNNWTVILTKYYVS